MSSLGLLVNLVKGVTGIRDISLFKKRMKKRLGKLIYKKKYSASDLINVMQEMGMKRGSTVCVHASMMEFYNFKGTAEEIIIGILDIIGPEGTLLMPAFPNPKMINDTEYIFNPRTDKTYAGYLAEVFREKFATYRSNNVRHSVCAVGANAEYLTKDHTKGHDCWDEKSPWQRMIELKALVFNLGMPHAYIGTFHHCVESVLQYEHPYWAQFFNEKSTYRYLDENSEIRSYTESTGTLERRTRERNLFKHFDEKDWETRKISNLEVKVFYTEHCFPKMLELGRKGISVYYVPSTRKCNFPN